VQNFAGGEGRGPRGARPRAVRWVRVPPIPAPTSIPAPEKNLVGLQLGLGSRPTFANPIQTFQSIAPGALIANVFRANELQPPKPAVKTVSIQLTASLVASGEFVGILPTSVAALSAHRAVLKVLPLKLSGPRVSAEIVFLKNRTLSPAVETFINCAREVVTSLVRSPGA
jgi:DNA-binding transcriptional LysR family regulator